MRRMILLSVVLLLPWSMFPAQSEEPGIEVLCDFETGEPTDTWEFAGVGVADISVSDGATASGGRGIKMIGKGRKGSIRRASAVADWNSFRAFSFYAAVESGERVELRIRALSGKGAAGMLKRFSLEPGPWREVVLPLADWREDLVDQVGDFAHVETVVVQWDQGEGEVSLDDLRLLPGKKGAASSRPTRRQFLELAFPAGDERVYQNHDFMLATNAPELNEKISKLLLAHCSETKELLVDRYRVPDASLERIPFVVFETKDEYRRYVQRLGKKFGMNVKPGANSTSILGICLSYYHPKYGWERPTFTYLAAGGAMRQLLGLGRTDHWVYVALASAAQVHLHPSAMPDDFVQKQMRGWVDGPRTQFRALGELLDPETSAGRYRGQLVSLMEYLAEERPDALARFWTSIRAYEKPIAQGAKETLLDAVDTDLQTLEDDYVDWGLEWLPKR